ncbi:MAG: class I SAM-dependent methyltransferase [Candidatus Binataceae bacterium]
MDERIKPNLLLWNDAVEVHARSAFYDLDGFKRGEKALHSIEIEEVGDVSGKSLLHLQCHFGMDTMAWARRGAKVTGLDFSDQAIDLARSLSRELNIPAEFVHASVYDAPAAVRDKFDIVFSSYGAICWLPELKPWARAIAQCLKPGGFFYIVDMHPFMSIIDYAGSHDALRVELSYFRTDVIVDAAQPDYADPTHIGKHEGHEWIHTVGEIQNSLIEAGLQIDFWHEFPVCVWQCLEAADRGADGYYRIKGDPIPLMFSVKATKQS